MAGYPKKKKRKPVITGINPYGPSYSRFTDLRTPGDNLVQRVLNAQYAANAANKAIKDWPGAAAMKKSKTNDLVLSMTGKRQVAGQGFAIKGHFYDLEMDFADGPLNQTMPLSDVYPPFDKDPKKNHEAYTHWGEAFANPLVDPRADYVYMVRLRISQLRPELLIRAYELEWTLPVLVTGWAWIDGSGTKTKHVVTSNPLHVIRLVRSPSNHAAMAQVQGGFTATVTRYWV